MARSPNLRVCLPVPEHDQGATFIQRVKKAYTETKVSPQWIDDSDSFWYRKVVTRNESSFIYVDPVQCLCRPAFDHDHLAKALNSQGVEANADDLPFTWIDLAKDGEYIRFRIGEKKWQFDNHDKSLIEYDGSLNEESLQPLQHEKLSEPSTTTTVITFINQTPGLISLLWIDFDGNLKPYATVGAGESSRIETFVGHVWRVVKDEEQEPIASFTAVHRESTAIVKEGMIPAAPVKKNSSDKDTSDSEASDETMTKHEDSTQSAFVRDYNVWVHDVTGEEYQLSTNGTKENPYDGNSIRPSPDTSFAVVYQYNPEQQHALYHIESSPKDQRQPRLKQRQYLKPGDAVRIDRPRLFDLTNKKEITVDDALFNNPYRISDLGWDGKEYRFRYNQRGHQVLRIIGIDIDGNVRTIIEDTSETFIDYSQKQYLYETKDSKELIWASERDGRNHIYLYDLQTGEVKNQVTHGEWIVHSVDWVDEEKRQIWFKVFALVKDQDPYYAHLARVNFDGSNLTVMTKGDGTHTWKWSPSKEYFVDTWSRLDLAMQCVLRKADTGKVVVALEARAFDKLSQVGWEPAERFTACGRDGETLIYGIIVRPSNFDPTQKYPIIEDIYAGPQDFFVPKAFSPLVRQHDIAELGFIVVQIDGMGTNWRSKVFHDHCYKNLKDSGFPDRIAWIRAAAESRPWMDLTRVGIFGSSAGGQSAMAALLWHGDFYKAAVADSGCHDNLMDKLWWNEAWMGWPIDQQVYDDSSNVVHAKNLKGALMLIVGELDDNVDPASTLQVVNALIEAEKDFDLIFVPGGTHGVGYSNLYCQRRQKDFFVKHLLHVDPPNRNMG